MSKILKIMNLLLSVRQIRPLTPPPQKARKPGRFRGFLTMIVTADCRKIRGITNDGQEKSGLVFL